MLRKAIKLLINRYKFISGIFFVYQICYVLRDCFSFCFHSSPAFPQRMTFLHHVLLFYFSAFLKPKKSIQIIGGGFKKTRKKWMCWNRLFKSTICWIVFWEKCFNTKMMIYHFSPFFSLPSPQSTVQRSPAK